MKQNAKFFSFWLLFALSGTATTVFNSCSKDDSGSNSIGGTSTSDPGVVINGVKWATRNVDKPGTFAAKPEDAGLFYQWNRKIGWSATDPMVNSTGGNTWDNSYPSGSTWESANDPSPTGWRMPTFDEIKTLLATTDKVSNEWTTQNGVSGRKFTDIATGKTLFLPAVGIRYGSDGTLQLAGTYGCYWGNAQDHNDLAYFLRFNSADWSYFDHLNGFSVRSVAK